MQIQINDLLPNTRMKESNFYTPAILKFMCSYFRILMNTLQNTAAKMCKDRYLLKIGQEEVKALREYGSSGEDDLFFFGFYICG